MIVETIKSGECTCMFDDEAYAGKTDDEIKKTIQMFSAFIAECYRKRETA